MIRKNTNLNILLLSLFVFSCDSRNHKDLVYEKLSLPKDIEHFDRVIAYNKVYELDGYYDSISEAYTIEGKLFGHTYGPSFLFSTKGKLLIYQVLKCTDCTKYRIIKYYDTGFYGEYGKPIFDYMIGQSDSLGYLKYSVLISKFPRQMIKVKVSKDGSNYTDLKTYKSINIPIVEECDVLAERGSKLYFIIETDSLLFPLNGIENQKTFYDTIIFR